jgi:hypothetical protein
VALRGTGGGILAREPRSPPHPSRSRVSRLEIRLDCAGFPPGESDETFNGRTGRRNDARVVRLRAGRTPPGTSTTATARRTPRPEQVKRRSIPGGGLRGALRLYQQIGVHLPAPTLSRLGLGADMGLGNTIQVLALLLVQHAGAGIQR